MDIIKILAAELEKSEAHIQNVITLIDEGNTIPFIARYRKEMTGTMDDVTLRKLFDRLTYLRGMQERQEAVIRLIDEQGKLTEELENKILSAKTMQEIEDLYRPYKQKKRTRAIVAKEKGLEPLAQFLLLRTNDDVFEKAAEFVNEEKGVLTTDDALSGARDIIAESVSDNAAYRKFIRACFLREGVLTSSCRDEEKKTYEMYFEFSQPVKKVANHRILAINRGESEGALSVKIEEPKEDIIRSISNDMLKEGTSSSGAQILLAIEDGYTRLIRPSVENEVRNFLTDRAGEAAIGIFSENLKNLLMQPPLKERVILGLDPAYRTGCKIAVVDAASKVVDTTVIYPLHSDAKREEATKTILNLIKKHGVEIIAIGNGTASKESEIFVCEVIEKCDEKIYYMVVSEAGASVYSASELGAEEFPDFDVSLRSAVSIARRLIDPLSELVKIDPKAIGVGQYQHDMNPKRLDESLCGVVEGCVNSVGVNLNTASVSLLSYVAGINKSISKNIVEFRETEGRFTNINQLKKVKKLGPKAFEQCAGFLRITDGENILDNTGVHPESYKKTEKMLSLLGFTKEDIKNKELSALPEKLASYGKNKMAQELEIGEVTLSDIVSELLKPGRDIRDTLPKPQLMSSLLDIKDLKEGMVLSGTVRNVIDFGAFIDIGVHQDGLLHISQISDKFISHPTDVLKVGDIVKVKVTGVDLERKRISLTMKDI